MKRNILKCYIAVGMVGLMVSTMSAYSFAEDFSFLDDMSDEQLALLEEEINSRRQNNVETETITAEHMLESQVSSGEVEEIALRTEYGSLNYTGYEYADPLYWEHSKFQKDFLHTVLIDFDYINYELSEKVAADDFEVKIYQNGVECQSGFRGYIDANDPVSRFSYTSVIKGGCVSTAQAVLVQDYSALLIYVTDVHDNTTQIMTLDLEEPERGAELDITKDQLIGEWVGLNKGQYLVLETDSFKIQPTQNEGGRYYGNWEVINGIVTMGAVCHMYVSYVDNQIHITLEGFDEYDDEYVNPEAAVYTDTIKVCSMGETVSTDLMEVTITDFSVNHMIDMHSYLPIDEGSGYVPSGDGMGYGTITFTVKNISKEALKWDNFKYFTINYNDGYKYEIVDSSYAYLAQPKSFKHVRYTTKYEEGSSIMVDPLTEAEFVLNIPCLEAIKDDTDSPLKIEVCLQASTKTESFVFDVRTQNEKKETEGTDRVISDKDTVQKVQAALNAKGYECGTPDGVAGQRTYAAINAFQIDNGLPVTTELTSELLEILCK